MIVAENGRNIWRFQVIVPGLTVKAIMILKKAPNLLLEFSSATAVHAPTPAAGWEKRRQLQDMQITGSESSIPIALTMGMGAGMVMSNLQWTINQEWSLWLARKNSVCRTTHFSSNLKSNSNTCYSWSTGLAGTAPAMLGIPKMPLLYECRLKET